MQALKSQKVVSKLLLALMLNVGVVNVAQALSPYQWEYWGLSESQLASIRNENPTLWYALTTSINNEMRRVAVNQGNLLNISNNSASFTPTHVGYANFSYSCMDAATCRNKIATFQLLPNATAQTLQIESNMNVYDLSLSASSGADVFTVSESEFAYKKNANAFEATTRYLNINGNNQNSMGIDGYDPNAGFIGFESTFNGQGFWGKIASASQLTALANNTSYYISGNTALGASVQITLNFHQASWVGVFGSAGLFGRPEYGYTQFEVNGAITDTSLTGSLSSANGAGAPRVTAATVNGTLVDISGNVGAVGAVSVTTQGNGTIGDAFKAQRPIIN